MEEKGNVSNPFFKDQQKLNDKQNKNRQVTLSIIGIAILIIGLVGITYAFFNYTRTGSSNVIKVGRISFNTVQGPSINLTNVFPIDSEDVDTDTDNVGSVAINVVGDTTYSNGVEYLITAVDVRNRVGVGYNSSIIPLSIDVSYSPNGNGKTVGTENNNYFDNNVRGGNTSYYKVLANNTINEDDKLIVGYIAPGQTGIDGNIEIKAYLDKDKIGISDTYPENEKYVINPYMSEELINTCVNDFITQGYEQYLRGNETLYDFCAGNGTLQGLTFEYVRENNYLRAQDVELLKQHDIIILVYADGTTNEWANGRTIISTDKWNSMQETGLSFKIKVEANEGIWVDEPLPENDLVNLNSIFNSSQKSSVKEIHFVNMSEEEINSHNNLIDMSDTNGIGSVKGWFEDTTDDKKILYIVSDGETYFPSDSTSMFVGFNNVESIIFDNVNTVNVRVMSGMFYNCRNLTSLDLSSFNTRNLIDMNAMFGDCRKLTSLDVSSFNTENVINMSSVFYNSTSLITITGLSNWNTENVESMKFLFYNTKISDISELSGWNVGRVNNMDYMFSETNISNLTPLLTWDTKNVTTMGSMLRNCSNITTLNGLQNWDVKKVMNFSEGSDSNQDHIEGTFEGLTSLSDASAINNWDINPNAIFIRMFLDTPVQPTFSKVAGTWNSIGSFIPNA